MKGHNPFLYGISTVNTLFAQNRIKIHSKLGKLHDHLSSYTRLRDGAGNFIEDRESKDVPTHMIDALRYVLATLNRSRNDAFTNILKSPALTQEAREQQAIRDLR